MYLVSIWTNLPSICDMEWRGVSVRIRVTFFSGWTTFYGTDYLRLNTILELRASSRAVFSNGWFLRLRVCGLLKYLKRLLLRRFRASGGECNGWLLNNPINFFSGRVIFRPFSSTVRLRVSNPSMYLSLYFLMSLCAWKEMSIKEENQPTINWKWYFCSKFPYSF